MVDLMFNNNFDVPEFVIVSMGLYSDHVVSAEEEFRPDLISLNFYGNVRYTLPILKLNNISCELLLSGTKIKLPSTSVVGEYE